jgi:hypothetical protein
MSGLVGIAVLAGVLVYAIATQVRGQSLQVKRLVLLPAILIVIGLSGLSAMANVTATSVGFITASAVLAAVIGVAQGAMTRLQSRNGMLWGQLPARGLWLWLALIASRVLMVVLAHAAGAEAAASLDAVIVALGVNRLAQAGAIASRAARRGLPLAL